MEIKNNEIKNQPKDFLIKTKIANQYNVSTLNNNFKTIYMYIPNKKK